MTVLQPHTGPIPGQHYVPAEGGALTWGRLPTPSRKPVLTIASGETVTFDTISHEGLMEDQGRDPLTYFGQRGVARDDVLTDLVDLAASDVVHTRGPDGPHVVTGPVHVEGAQPGDILKVEYLELTPRVPYGVVSSRHGLGCLAGERPADDTTGEAVPIISQFCTVDLVSARATMEWNSGSASFPIAPFMGLSGVTAATEEALNTIPPGAHGGNMDVRDLAGGSVLYLPVQVDGAGYYMGDPHFAQGNGEVSLTALEASLRTTVRLTVLTPDEAFASTGALSGPFGETSEHWIAIGMDRDLDEAVKKCVREAIRILGEVAEVPPSVAYLYLSAAADLAVSQVVDDVKGVHCLIRKKDFPAWT
ncbi:acetamidase/formamidase family protein [Rhodococcus rhodochrous]|uniref:Acetamidase/formamidase family protein n=1 Tax=Rhodococcus rhodochrous TaxID=1829 RepID=A0AAW4XED7_RHORH|nr:acetamidase/formamidase family protein [Rhodococcus rhodochrous]MCD2111318.1 acetamidase/formamidase family protein [Rhodococcus rhodochrous]QHG81313.1 acetamidase [Rhodococcus rhodochrous]QOH58876.1 acetamidase [Rhodococcus rhodochrous]